MDTRVVRQLTKTAISMPTPLKKIYIAVHFTKSSFCQFVNRKVVGLMPKYYLLAGDASQVYFFHYIR